jgi:hypothetical protein
MERVTLPSSIQTLSLGGDFKQSLERVTLPSSLCLSMFLYITLKRWLNQFYVFLHPQ